LFISLLSAQWQASRQPNFAAINAAWQRNGRRIQRPVSLSRNSY
jgi:hypothetical protein